jgi:hypothetical protein
VTAAPAGHGYRAMIGWTDSWSPVCPQILNALDLALDKAVNSRERELEILKELQANTSVVKGNRT